MNRLQLPVLRTTGQITSCLRKRFQSQPARWWAVLAVALLTVSTVLVTGSMRERTKKAAAETALVRASIERVLQLEAPQFRLGATIWAERTSIPPIIGSYISGNVSSQMEMIDTTSCPADFRTAFLDYVLAWNALGQSERIWDSFEIGVISTKSEREWGKVGDILTGKDPAARDQEIEAQRSQYVRSYQAARRTMEEKRVVVLQNAIQHHAQTSW